jgi:hypothetical protein
MKLCHQRKVFGICFESEVKISLDKSNIIVKKQDLDGVASAPTVLDYYYHLLGCQISELTLGELPKLLSVRAV